MYVAFILTMPNNNSWNGKWSGEGRLYCRTVNVGSSKKTREKYEALAGNHYYNFGDGWGANVEVKEVDGDMKRKLDKRSAGFCGYDWMIESLRAYGKIMNDSQRREHLAATR